jgi:hypothetical protein
MNEQMAAHLRALDEDERYELAVALHANTLQVASVISDALNLYPQALKLPAADAAALASPLVVRFAVGTVATLNQHVYAQALLAERHRPSVVFELHQELAETFTLLEALPLAQTAEVEADLRGGLITDLRLRALLEAPGVGEWLEHNTLSPDAVERTLADRARETAELIAAL